MKHILIVLGHGHIEIWNGIKDLLTPRDREYMTILEIEGITPEVVEDMVQEKLKKIKGDEEWPTEAVVVLIGDNTHWMDIRSLPSDTMNLEEIYSGFDIGFFNLKEIPKSIISKLLLSMIKNMADPDHVHILPEKQQ